MRSVFGNNNALRAVYLQNNELSAATISDRERCRHNLDAFDISNNPNTTHDRSFSLNAKVFNVSNTNLEVCKIPSDTIAVFASSNKIEAVSYNSEIDGGL